MQINWTPPRNRIEITTVGKPGPGSSPMAANWWANTFCANVNTAPRNANDETTSPRCVATFSGTAENEITPSSASLSDLLKVYCGVPATRAWRSNLTVVWRKPHQDRSPTQEPVLFR